MNTRVRRHTWLSALLGAVAALAVQGLQAAQADPAVPAPEAESAPVEVSDEKLRQFVTAATDVQDIQQEYITRAQTLQEETQQKMVEKVEDAGMTLAEFQSISVLVQNDPDLLRRLDEINGE